jgi:CRP-like cAMP-binding protein
VQLFQQGARADDVFFLEHGLVKLLRGQCDGRETIVGLRTAGSFLAAGAVVLDHTHVVTAVTLTSCLVSRMTAEWFRRALRSQPALSWALHEMESREISEQQIRVSNLSCLSARERLEHLLGTVTSEAGRVDAEEPVRIRFPLKGWEVAQLLGITPPYLSELLADLERDGVLQRQKGWLILLRPLRLSRPQEG